MHYFLQFLWEEKWFILVWFLVQTVLYYILIKAINNSGGVADE